MSDETLSDRLNRLAREKKKELDAHSEVQRTEEQENKFIYENARSEFENLLKMVSEKVDSVNSALEGLPPFEWKKGGGYVKQGNVAAFLSFQQPFLNAGPIVLMISFGREPEGFYLDIEGFSEAPDPERYRLQPAMGHSPERIVWDGDLGELSSGQLVDFLLTNLSEYYLAHKRA
jgi:hypothetical protein